MKRIGRFVLLALCCIGLSAAEPDFVDRALDSVERDNRKDWAYTMTVVEDGKERVERFDPSRDDDRRWVLVRVEGRPPAAGDLKDYEETKRRRKDNDRGVSLRDMIREGTLRLVRENQRRAVYTFEVKGKDDKEQKMMDHVDAELYIDKTGPWVERLELRNAEEFNPMIGVKIDRFAMTITYLPIDDGPVAPERIETRILGKAFLIKSIDSDVRVTFSDYQYVGK